MLNKMASKLAMNLLSHKTIEEDHYDIYVYGFELLLSFLFSTTVIMIIGIALSRVWQTLAFLTVFIFLRSYTGGYHAKTYAMCSLVTFSLFGIVLILSELVKVPMAFYIVLAIIGIALIFICAPVEHPNKKITEKQKNKFKRISIVLFTIFITAGVLLNGIDASVSSAIFFALIADLLLMFKKIKKKGENKNEVC